MLSDARNALPGADEFHQQMPLALANAVDGLGPRYDAIVVDEAQDFGDEYWLPLEMMLTKPDESMLYVFLDENQDIYRRSSNIPVPGEPMVLDRNCRNTDAIHSAAYRHYRGVPVEPPQISGVAVERLVGSDLAAQAKAICGVVTRLLTDEAVEPHDIAILLCDPSDRLERERALQNLPLPKTAKLGRIEDFEKERLTVDTVARFKGLERGVIILWAFDRPNLSVDRETFYVGMSRAKSVLYLCGTSTACDRLFVPQS